MTSDLAPIIRRFLAQPATWAAIRANLERTTT